MNDYLMQNWGRDSGHALTGITLAIVAYAGYAPGWALLTAAVFAAVALVLARTEWYISGAIFLAIFFGLLVGPNGTYGAALVGGLAYMVPKEIGDILRQKGKIKLDNVSDAVSYQFAWPLLLALFVSIKTGAMVLGMVGGLYLLLVYFKTK